MNSDYLFEQLTQQTGVDSAQLLAPISDSAPGGIAVRENGVYRAINAARRADDPSLPQGDWAHDLKQANWPEVSRLATDTLSQKSKDLQIAIWLLEAQLNRYGFAGIAPTVVLIHALCERYWDTLHPVMRDGDLEYRTNILRWANEKLLPAVRTAPLTRCGEQDICWADWQTALRNEQLRVQLNSEQSEQLEGLGIDACRLALAATETPAWREQYSALTAGLEAIENLVESLDRLCGDESPSLGLLTGLLEEIAHFVAAELRKRGDQFASEGAVGAEVVDPVMPPNAIAIDDAPLPGNTGVEPCRQGSRDQAYCALVRIADQLMQLEPHSPVPYLIQRAVEWGGMGTAELYQALFVEGQGQINIFELLGLDIAPGDDGR